MGKWIILLGGNELNAGVVSYAREVGNKLCVVDWNINPLVTGDKHIQLDIKAVDEVLNAITSMEGGVNFAYTSADAATETAASINSFAGLARPDIDSLNISRNKVAMNEAWLSKGLLNKKYSRCEYLQNLIDFRGTFDGNIIVKPATSSSSRGITILSSHGAANVNLEAVFSKASSYASDGLVIAEEFVEGTEFTVEMIGDAFGNVEVWGVSKKYHTYNSSNNCIAVKLHYNPPEESDAALREVAKFGTDCYRALGLHSSLGHFEVLRRPNGSLVPVELAARSSGFIASHLVSILHGQVGSYLTRYRDMIRGASLSNEFKVSDKSSMYFFYDPPPGVWTVDGASLPQFLGAGIQSIASERRRLNAGLRIGEINSDDERLGFEILVGSRTDLQIKNIISAEERLYGEVIL